MPNKFDSIQTNTQPDSIDTGFASQAYMPWAQGPRAAMVAAPGAVPSYAVPEFNHINLQASNTHMAPGSNSYVESRGEQGTHKYRSAPYETRDNQGYKSSFSSQQNSNRYGKSLSFNIIKYLGQLSAPDSSGWSKELNLVSWNNGQPRYDIRSWSNTHEHMSKGIGLSAQELVYLYLAIEGLRMSDAQFAALLNEAVAMSVPQATKPALSPSLASSSVLQERATVLEPVGAANLGTGGSKEAVSSLGTHCPSHAMASSDNSAAYSADLSYVQNLGTTLSPVGTEVEGVNALNNSTWSLPQPREVAAQVAIAKATQLAYNDNTLEAQAHPWGSPSCNLSALELASMNEAMACSSNAHSAPWQVPSPAQSPASMTAEQFFVSDTLNEDNSNPWKAPHPLRAKLEPKACNINDLACTNGDAVAEDPLHSNKSQQQDKSEGRHQDINLAEDDFLSELKEDCIPLVESTTK